MTEKHREKIPKNIIGINRTNNVNELVEIYSSADVFVNPTLEDNFPTTNLEALACGTPVITFNTGGSSESLNEETGIVVKNESIQEILGSIQKIKDNRSNFRIENCRKRAIEKYNKNLKFNEYIELYRSIVK